MPVYHSGKLSRTGRPDFNYPLRPSTPDLTVPFAPRNPMVTSPYIIGKTDVRWDNPRLIPQNNGLDVVGCNVYRSIDADFGPYVKINDTPVDVLFYRDETKEELVTEDVTNTLRYADEPDGNWRVYAQNRPIVIPGSNGKVTDRVEDVTVEIDNGDGTWVEAPAYIVAGSTGEIVLISRPTYNQTVEQVIPPRLPWPPNGKVRLTYRYLKHHVLSRLHQRLFYKVTTVAVDPEDNSKRIETPLEEVEWRSTHDIEEIDYIWREAMRRNNWILEQGGERVKIFVRKWMGERCPDYKHGYGQGHADCHICFHPETLVRSSEGWKPIKDIVEGSMVLSSDGSFHKVNKVFERPYEGDLISIMPSISTNPILVTPNHPFLVMHSTHKRKDCGPSCNKFIANGDGLRLEKRDIRKLPGGKYWARVSENRVRKSLGTFYTEEEAAEAIIEYKIKEHKPQHTLIWKRADEIKKNDWVVSKWNQDIKDFDEISIPDDYKKKGHDGPPRRGSRVFKLDEEFLWMVGLYIAEGSAGTRSITFALHEDERDYQKRLIIFFKKYGYNASLYQRRGKGVVVHVSSSSLSEWFPEWIGKKCYNKIIPEELMYLPEEKTRSLIAGIHDGDGSKNDREITQTSECLALQIAELLHRVGEQPLIRKQISRKRTPKGNKRRIAYCVSWAEDTFNHFNRKGRWIFKEEMLAKVKKLSKVAYSGKVFNLEVDEDPTYVTQGIVAHNCYGTSYVGGYSGPYDVIIAPPEAEKSIELMDMGLHIRYDFESWMMAFPMLKERDVIVRQNNERYIVGPVNYQGSRGAIYQQHFTLSHIDEDDIRYKIGISGGETAPPESWDRYRQDAPTEASPIIPDKPEIPKSRIIKGRTVTFENITY